MSRVLGTEGLSTVDMVTDLKEVTIQMGYWTLQPPDPLEIHSKDVFHTLNSTSCLCSEIPSKSLCLWYKLN